MNSGDVYLHDLGLRLVQFNGKDSSGREHIKAMELCRAIDDERENLPEVVVFEEYSRPEDWPAEWVDLLGRGPFATAAEGGDDLAFERQGTTRVLLRLSYASGTLQMTQVAEGAAVTRDKLDGSDFFIVDSGAEVFAWVGLGASHDERRQGMQYAI